MTLQLIIPISELFNSNSPKDGVIPSSKTGILAPMLGPEDLAREKIDAALGMNLRGLTPLFRSLPLALPSRSGRWTSSKGNHVRRSSTQWPPRLPRMRLAGWNSCTPSTGLTLPHRAVAVRRSSTRARNCLNLNAGHQGICSCRTASAGL